MATVFREPNQVKWIGVRPGHNGEQVLEGFIAGAINFTAIYTVPANKMFMMTYAALSNTLNIGGNAYLCIYDDTPAIWRVLFGRLNIVNVPGRGCIATFNPPIELPEGYSVRVYQSALIGTIGSVHGFVIDV